MILNIWLSMRGTLEALNHIKIINDENLAPTEIGVFKNEMFESRVGRERDGNINGFLWFLVARVWTNVGTEILETIFRLWKNGFCSFQCFLNDLWDDCSENINFDVSYCLRANESPEKLHDFIENIKKCEILMFHNVFWITKFGNIQNIVFYKILDVLR